MSGTDQCRDAYDVESCGGLVEACNVNAMSLLSDMHIRGVRVACRVSRVAHAAQVSLCRV